MSLENGNVNLIRRYLLEDLSEEEREHIEQLLMLQDEFYQELLYAEDDLIDDYIFGRLPDEDQPKFKKRFLQVPQLRQSVKLTAALRKHALETTPLVVAEAPVPSSPTVFDSLRSFFTRPAVGLAFSAMLLGVIGLNVWLLKQNSQLRSRVGELEIRQSASPVPDPQQELKAALQSNEQLKSDLERRQQLLAEESRRRQLAEEQLKGLTRRPVEVGGTGVLAFTLFSGGNRDSGGTTKVPLQPDTGRVQFKLDLAARDYPRYNVVLYTAEGLRVRSRSNLRLTPEKVVLFEVPAKALSSGDYRIVLSGVKSSGARDELDNYYFRVSK
jgi:hypothetical protein